MLFAVIQKEFSMLDPVKLTEVYSDVFELSKIDAQTKIQAKPCGILAFGLEETQADKFIEKLSVLNYPCYKRKISELVPLHDSVTVHSAVFSDSGITFENLFGKQQRILWNHIQMVELYKLQGKSISLQNRKKAKRIGKPSTVTIKKEQMRIDKYIDIYSDSPSPRIQIEASRFNYSGLAEKMTSDSQLNFQLLVEQIKSYCDKYKLEFRDSTQQSSYSSIQELERYSHWKLQL